MNIFNAEPEYLKAAKANAVEAIEAIKFDQNPDTRIEAAQALIEMIEGVLISNKALLEMVAREIDSHTPINSEADIIEMSDASIEMVLGYTAPNVEAFAQTLQATSCGVRP